MDLWPVCRGWQVASPPAAGAGACAAAAAGNSAGQAFPLLEGNIDDAVLFLAEGMDVDFADQRDVDRRRSRLDPLVDEAILGGAATLASARSNASTLLNDNVASAFSTDETLTPSGISTRSGRTSAAPMRGHGRRRFFDSAAARLREGRARQRAPARQFANDFWKRGRQAVSYGQEIDEDMFARRHVLTVARRQRLAGSLPSGSRRAEPT
jgi:hypothetical protein